MIKEVLLKTNCFIKTFIILNNSREFGTTLNGSRECSRVLQINVQSAKVLVNVPFKIISCDARQFGAIRGSEVKKCRVSHVVTVSNECFIFTPSFHNAIHHSAG